MGEVLDCGQPQPNTRGLFFGVDLPDVQVLGVARCGNLNAAQPGGPVECSANILLRVRERFERNLQAFPGLS